MRRRGFTLIELMIVIAIIAILAAILVPNFIRARAQGQHTSCQSNCKNIGTALEMYSTDNAGRYPPTAGSIGELTTDYIKAIPLCPSTGNDTYSVTYETASVPDAFTFGCGTTNHKGAGVTNDNMPQYGSAQGLIPR